MISVYFPKGWTAHRCQDWMIQHQNHLLYCWHNWDPHCMNNPWWTFHTR